MKVKFKHFQTNKIEQINEEQNTLTKILAKSFRGRKICVFKCKKAYKLIERVNILFNINRK